MKKQPITYSHKELALMYFPKSNPKTASWRFTCWLLRDPEFYHELTQAGYIRGQRLFTPRQFDLIRHFLGDPEPADWSSDEG